MGLAKKAVGVQEGKLGQVLPHCQGEWRQLPKCSTVDEHKFEMSLVLNQYQNTTRC